MENNQPVTPQEQPIMQPPATLKKSNALIMVLGGIVLLGLGLLGGYFLFGNKSQPSTQTVQTVTQVSPTETPTPTADMLSEINGFPVYIGATFVKKEVTQPCTGNESGFSTCGSTTYTWQTSDDYMKVNSFYMSDTSQSGWKCSGGAGAVGGPRDATTKTSCKKATMSYSLNLEANATETKITLAIPTQNNNASDVVVGLNESCLGRTNRVCATGLKCQQPPQSAADAPGTCVKE